MGLSTMGGTSGSQGFQWTVSPILTKVFCARGPLTDTTLTGSVELSDVNGGGGTAEGAVIVRMPGAVADSTELTWSTLDVVQDFEVDLTAIPNRGVWRDGQGLPFVVWLAVRRTSGLGQFGVRWTVPPVVTRES